MLLDVCRQLKAEFSCLYYHNNIFTCQCTESDLDRELSSTDSLIRWLKRIGPRNRGMLREIQMRILSQRSFHKDELFGFLRNQNVRISREVGWVPLSVLRVRLDLHWLTQLELNELILKKLIRKEIEALESTGSSVPKGPDLIVWKRGFYDPVIDKYSKPGKRQLSEFVCPATWQYYARAEVYSNSDKDSTDVPIIELESEAEAGCLSGGLRVLVAKVRRGKGVVAKFRRKRGRRKTERAIKPN